MTFASILANEAFSEQFSTPESFTEQIVLKPYFTEVIEEKDYKKAIIQLDQVNARMTVDGWILFQMVEYIDSGNFKGFIVTYKKAEEKVSSKK
jgi:hypothetical protein